MLAWAFELTPGGITRDQGASSAEPEQTPKTSEKTPTAEPTAREKSIAVLPFVNMSSDPEQEYFSDGLTEEILNLLAKVPGLKVIARTSSFAFKGKNEDVRSIGQALDVNTVLEGSVRKSGNRVRVTYPVKKRINSIGWLILKCSLYTLLDTCGGYVCRLTKSVDRSRRLSQADVGYTF